MQPLGFQEVRTHQRPESLYLKSPSYEEELAGRKTDPIPCLSSEEPPLDLTGKVYQLEVMLKQLHTDLQKVRLTVHCLPAPHALSSTCLPTVHLPPAPHVLGSTCLP